MATLVPPDGPSYSNFIAGSVSHPYYVGTTQGGANNGGAIWGYSLENAREPIQPREPPPMPAQRQE